MKSSLRPRSRGPLPPSGVRWWKMFAEPTTSTKVDKGCQTETQKPQVESVKTRTPQTRNSSQAKDKTRLESERRDKQTEATDIKQLIDKTITKVSFQDRKPQVESVKTRTPQTRNSSQAKDKTRLESERRDKQTEATDIKQLIDKTITKVQDRINNIPKILITSAEETYTTEDTQESILPHNPNLLYPKTIQIPLTRSLPPKYRAKIDQILKEKAYIIDESNKKAQTKHETKGQTRILRFNEKDDGRPLCKNCRKNYSIAESRIANENNNRVLRGDYGVELGDRDVSVPGRYGYPSDRAGGLYPAPGEETLCVACGGALSPPAQRISWRTEVGARAPGRHAKDEGRGLVSKKESASEGGPLGIVETARRLFECKMPLLPGVRDVLSSPRSARAPSARRPPPAAPQPAHAATEPGGGMELRRQNEELRARLASGAADSRRRLDTYRRAQQGQAALVARLQAKVLQYKQRCSDLEGAMEPTPRPPDSYRSVAAPRAPAVALPPPPAAPAHYDERIHDLDTALRRLEDERRKCEKLIDQNTTLREQLEESHQINEALTNDLQKLTNDWEALREEMIVKEDEWKDEEQAFNDYYTTEHNRLLNLWRDVVSVKRQFSEMQSATERDLYKVKSNLDSTARDMLGTVSNFSISNLAASQGLKPDLSSSSGPSCDSHTLPTMPDFEDLRSNLREMTSQRDRALADLRERDTRVQRLLGELQGLEERCESAEVVASEAGVMRNALEEVARALILDSEGDGGQQAAERIQMPERSPKRGRPHTPNSTAFAESTISAVQAALHKYQLHIHELQVKLQNTREQLLTNRKHCEIAEANVNSLESRVHDLQGKLDQANASVTQLLQEKESMQKTLETLRADKNNLERNRLEINAMVESLTSDYEKLQKANTKLEKLVETLDGEKRTLQSEADHLQREASNREAILRSEEERSSRLRTELVTVREELNKCHLARDLLEQQKMETDSLLSEMEKNRSDLEIELERTIIERSDLQNAVDKLEAVIIGLEMEKKKLQDDNKQLQEDKSSLAGQSSDQQGDLNSLRKELLAAEQTRLDLESDKNSLHERIKFIEGEKEKVELELGQVTRERNDLSSQLMAMGRKKDTLNEEIIRLQQRLEQASETNARLNRTLEEYVKDNEEKQVIIDGNEKDMQHLQEQLAAMRSEKDALEAVLFDTSNMLEDIDSKRSKLEKELQETLLVKENLKGQVTRLTRDLESTEKRLRDMKNSMSQQSGKKEAEYQQIITNLNKTTTENIRKLNEEKEQIRQTLEHKLSQTIAALTNEKEAAELAARDKEKRLRAARDSLALQHEEAMLRAENDKQQALLMAHHDQQALMERLEEAKRGLDNEQNNLDRIKREALAKADQDRTHINQLKDELSSLKTRLEEAKVTAEDDCNRLENRIKELCLEKEACQRECQDIRVQLQLTEDKYDNLRNQLQDTLRKLKEVENESESIRKELTDTRRQLTTCTAEREKYSATCRDLREHVKKSEQDRRETARALDEAYHKIANLEEVRTQLEAERSRLQGVLKETEQNAERGSREARGAETELKRERALAEQMQHDGKEMQSRLQNESEERERCANDAAAARRHAAELEALLNAARNELTRTRQKVAELEEGCRVRDQELVMRLEDCRAKERRLEELKHNLEVCLADATQQIQELKARLGGAEGRCRGLDAQLANSEAARRECCRRLSSVVSALRRVAGVQPDGTVQPAARQRRMTSPARRYSPHRGQDHSEDRGEMMDVDPELIKKGIRTLMHEVAQIEREKEDYKTQLSVVRKQLKETTEQQGKGEGKLNAVVNNLRSVQEEKARLMSVVSQKEAQLKTQNEAIQCKTVEVNSLRDKITNLETTLSSLTEEKLQSEDKVEKSRLTIQQLEADIAELREALGASEARASRLDVRRTQLEGDAQRAVAAQRERDLQLQKVQDRCEGYARTVTALEDRCTSLKGTVEQLSASLQKAASSESELRAELSRVQRHLNEAKQNEQSATDKLRQIQKSVANCENEKRVLAEKMESAKNSVAELKRLNASLEDQVHRLNNQLANVEVQRSGLESQLRLTTWDGKESADSDLERELHMVQREKSELKAKVDALLDTVRRLETDKQLPKTSPYRSKSHDRGEKSVYYSDLDSGPDSSGKDSHRLRCSKLIGSKEGGFSAELSLLEIENRELKMKIRRLEKELTDKETELSLARSRFLSDPVPTGNAERDQVERYRQAASQAEQLLHSRESSHRQQVMRLENQAHQLRTQLAAEIRRRQSYVARSGRAARDVQRLRTALGDSLRTVSQEPALDSYLLEHEARKLDSTLSHSLPPLNDSYDSSK